MRFTNHIRKGGLTMKREKSMEAYNPQRGGVPLLKVSES